MPLAKPDPLSEWQSSAFNFVDSSFAIIDGSTLVVAACLLTYLRKCRLSLLTRFVPRTGDENPVINFKSMSSKLLLRLRLLR